MKFNNLSSAIGFRQLINRFNLDDLFPESKLSLATRASVVSALRVICEYRTPDNVVVLPGVQFDGELTFRDSTNIDIAKGLYMDWIVVVKDDLELTFKEVRVAGHYETMSELINDPNLAKFADHDAGCLRFKAVQAGLIFDPTYLLTGYADCLASMMFNTENIVEVDKVINLMEFKILQPIEVSINGVMHCVIFPDDTLRLPDCPEAFDYIKVFATMAAMNQNIYSMNIVVDEETHLFAVEPL